MADRARKSTGLSFHPDDATVGEGLFGAGPATAKSHIFGVFKYPSGNMAGKKVTALLVTFVRDGEKHTEAMTVGKGFKPSDDGRTLMGGDAKGLPSSCKMMQYMKSITDDGADKAFIAEASQDITVLDGIDGTLIRKPMEKGEGMSGNPTVLVWDDIDSGPWKTGGKKKKKAADDDDEPEEKPKKRKAAADDDDDDDEPPKKKKKKAEEEDDDEPEPDDDEDEDDLEKGTEALIEALEDGALRLSKVETAVAAVLKKDKRGKQIAALMATPKTLKKENGWTFDGKTVSLE